MKRICIECGGSLKTIGYERENGKSYFDWSKRNLHIKCWKKIQEQKELELFRKRLDMSYKLKNNL